MKLRKWSFAALFCLLANTSSQTITAQQPRPLVNMSRVAPHPVAPLSSAAQAQIMARGAIADSAASNGVSGFGHNGSASNTQSSANHFGFPVWRSSFRTNGVEYPFTVVGSDPASGRTTVVPTVIIPYRLVYPATGDVFDASSDLVGGVTPMAGVLNSPIFNATSFSAGPTFLGNTQYGDAMIRANFWAIHSDRGQGYHVLLGTPTVLPVQTITVDPENGFVAQTPSGVKFGLVDQFWLQTKLDAVMLDPANHITPSTLPIHLFSLIEETIGGRPFAGFHSAEDLGTGGIQTFIVTSYYPESALPSARNTGILGHEIAEWMNDPAPFLTRNTVPLWQEPDIPRLCDNDLLEVGDPLTFLGSVYNVQTSSVNYVLPEVAFLPWFSRTQRSLSVNGWYTSLDSFTSHSEPCPAFPVDPNPDFSEILPYFAPNNDLYFNGVNNKNQIVTYVSSSQGAGSFVGEVNPTDLSFNFTEAIQVPWSPFATFAIGIDDTGKVVGVYLDQAQSEHGFLLDNGVYTSIDFPGALATEARGINSSDEDGHRPEVVGDYMDQAGVFHGFVLRGGRYISVDAPFAQNLFITGVNREHKLVGAYNPVSSPNTTQGFNGTLNRLTPIDYPVALGFIWVAGLNDRNESVGYVAGFDSFTGLTSVDSFQEVNNFYNGVIVVGNTFLNGINNGGWEVGNVVIQGQSWGLIQRPTASSQHGGHRPSMMRVSIR